MTNEYILEAAYELVKKLPILAQLEFVRDFRKITEAFTAKEAGLPQLESRFSSWILRIIIQHFYRQTPLELPEMMQAAVTRELPGAPVYECITCGFPQPKEFISCVLCGNLTGPEGSYGKRKMAKAGWN